MTLATRVAVCLSCAGLTLVPATAFAARVVSPAAGAVVRPGSEVPVVVTADAGQQIAELWFATTDGQTQAPAGALTANVRIPPSAVGPEFILAYAKLADGSISISSVRVIAEPGALDRLTASGPPILDRVGQLVQLEVRGVFADGIARDLTHGETGTSYTSTNDAVLGVHSTGVVQARSRGSAQIIVVNRGRTAVVTVAVDLPSPAPNRIPVPHAGSDQTVGSETFVRLDGTASQDPDSDAIAHTWQQEAGPEVLLRDPDASRPWFVAPRVGTTTVLVFSVIVTDSRGATSFPAVVTITVQPQPPAGVD